MLRPLILLVLGPVLTGSLLVQAQSNNPEQPLAELEQRIAVDPQQAIDEAETWLTDPALAPDLRTRLQILIADAHLQQGDFEAADTIARDVIAQRSPQLSPSQHANLLGVRAALPWRQGNLTEALRIMLQAYRLVADTDDTATIARSANRLGILYSNLGRPDEALNYYQIALRLDRAAQAPPASIASTLGNIGLLYHLLNDYPEAARYQSESIALFEEAQDPYGIARNQTNLAITRSKIAHPEAAIAIVNQSLATFIELGDIRGQTSALLARATIFNTLDQPAQSLTSIAQVMPLLTAQQADGEIAEALTIKARALFKLDRTDAALTHAQRALSLAQEVGMTNALVNAHQLLAAIHESRGEFADALVAERAAAAAQQEQLDARRHDLLAVLEVEFATAERERALAELRAQHAEQALSLQQEHARLRNALGGIGVILLIAIGLYQGYRTKTAHARELQSANTQLAALNAEKSALMDIASHDLRGRLATIRWQAEARVHQTSTDLPPEVKKDFTVIAEGAGEMHQKVSRLLDAQRADSAATLAPAQSIHFAAWLTARADSFATAARNKSIDIRIESPDTLPWTGHPDELAIIVDNLLDNALKYSPAGSRVTAAVSELKTGDLQLTITDQGPGIPADEQPRIFEKFQRLSPQPTGGETSTGLGLAIVKRLCDRLGIAITVQSTVGQGTCFRLVLPA